MAYLKQNRLPPGCGRLIGEPYLYNPYIHDPEHGFMTARRKRVCLQCKTIGLMATDGTYHCRLCNITHTSNLTAPRAFDQLLLLAGRGGGKTLAGAHAVRDELMIPNSTWWVMAKNYTTMHDSTFPTMVGLIDPRWIKRWDAEHKEITLHNGSLLAFRSLEDPERARGPHGVAGGWFDEAAQCPVRAYEVFKPTLTKAAGIIIATTTVFGYDWTYDEIEQKAVVYKEPGYWACRFHSEENPLFRTNPTMQARIERDKRTMDPAFFAQEYQAERRNAQGLVYDFSLIEKQCLLDAIQVKRLIPEWPAIDPARPVVVGLDSGADHPFGAVMIVATEGGLVVVREYLERQKAISQHLPAIMTQFGLAGFTDIKWASNKNEANLRLEFALKGIGVIPAENKHEVGIQRVQSWLYTKKIFFAYTCPKTIEQMRAYRYADNSKPTGEKKNKEEVFKFKDELPDGVRYAVMAWPDLPEATEPLMTDAQKARWDGLTDKQRADIERVRQFNEREAQTDLEETDDMYPVGSFFGVVDEREW